MFICQTLNIHREGGFLSLRGYRQSKARGLSARALRDAALIEKMWRVLRR
ncbi:transposase-like protein [Corynebacterium diphtheriae 31A]|nr:transposase-like protein [Corynebacterium diphtheriae 31A]AEX41139.1 transposase-like protein [Corynebacterium diphtheriae 31A]